MCAWLLSRLEPQHTLALGVAQRGRLVKELLSLLPKCGNGLSKRQELLFRVAHQFHQDVPLPSALAAKASYDFFQLLLELLGLTCEDRGSAAARLRDACDERQGFLRFIQCGGIGDPLAALLTRKVSMTRCAGPTRPSSIAAAAWMAISSSMSASSIRPRNSQRVSGSTKCTCERGAWYSREYRRTSRQSPCANGGRCPRPTHPVRV